MFIVKYHHRSKGLRLQIRHYASKSSWTEFLYKVLHSLTLSYDSLLHATTQAQHQVERGLLLDVVVGERASVFQLFASEDKTLLVRRDTLFVLNLCFDIVDRI